MLNRLKQLSEPFYELNVEFSISICDYLRFIKYYLLCYYLNQ